MIQVAKHSSIDKIVMSPAQPVSADWFAIKVPSGLCKWKHLWPNYAKNAQDDLILLLSIFHKLLIVIRRHISVLSRARNGQWIPP